MALGELARRSLARAGVAGLVDGKPTSGLLFKVLDDDPDVEVLETRWVIPTGIAEVGMTVEIGAKKYEISALKDSGEIGDTWVLRNVADQS